MPSCYLLVVTVGSSLDQQSNNVTLFNLVEQINIPPRAPRPPRGLIPLEVHAYFRIKPEEVGQPFEVRYGLVARTGLETYGEVFTYKSLTVRYRTRTFGIPMPPVADHYDLRLDWRWSPRDDWHRDHAAWPLTIAEHNPTPVVTH